MKKNWLQFTILLSIVMAAVSGMAFAADGPAPANVVLVMESTRSKIIKYMYKDLSKGLKKLNVEAKIEVVPYKDAGKKLFAANDAVIVISERQNNVLNPAILPFIQENVENMKLITVSFLPGRNTALPPAPEGVDVLSSASGKFPAQKFVVNDLAAEVVKRLKK
ncbi:MAG: hypothetical protein B0D92_00675 [Spirochaeta sp. LUC14_002_19_P3]|nr:MAG: hypothetical protein B0D92_00675 [Spirochaeta sp. LUC14_002_19_P3]